jgi:hypothetical protein
MSETILELPSGKIVNRWCGPNGAAMYAITGADRGVLDLSRAELVEIFGAVLAQDSELSFLVRRATKYGKAVEVWINTPEIEDLRKVYEAWEECAAAGVTESTGSDLWVKAERVEASVHYYDLLYMIGKRIQGALFPRRENGLPLL